MEFDKKTIFAIILIGLVLMLVQTEFYQKEFLPVRPEQRQPVDTFEERKPTEKESVVSDAEPLTSQVQEEAIAAAPQPQEDHLLGKGEDIRVDTDLYQAVFSTKGATLKSFRLKNYTGPDGDIVEIIGQIGHGNLALVFPTREDSLDTSPYLFTSNKTNIVLDSEGGVASLEFVLNLNEESTIKKVFTFQNGSYTVGLRVELINFSKTIDGFSYSLVWRSGMASTEPDFETDMTSTKCFVYQGEINDFDISDEPAAESFEGSTDWVGISTKYFAAAVIPKSAKGQGVKFKGQPINVGMEVPYKHYSYDLNMPFGQKAKRVDEFVLFMGPLDFDIVSSYNVRLEAMMDLGFALFRPFGKFVLWSFTLLHQFIPNYGFVIIIFSILIKILLFPLTKKSSQSMKEMQLLQPMMQELNEKFKDKPQKKQEELMKLYKEYGINPLGGCIPMLLQMPLLIALFTVFQSTIELRGASFIWWIQDLSRPDTIHTLPFSIPLYGNTVNILPLFMGITMFIQQKMTMKDPKQKAMVYFMPLFLTLLFNSFPSGLNLYYALFNLLSILQDKFMPYKIRTLEEMKASRAQKAKARKVKHDYRGGARK